MNDFERGLLKKYPQPEGQPLPYYLRDFVREHLVQRFAQLGFTRGAEVGTLDGEFALYMCQTIPGLKLICVDPWSQYDEDPDQENRNRKWAKQGVDIEQVRYEHAKANLAPYEKVLLLRKMSMDAVRDVPDGVLDFVYIDGNHTFDYVMQDLIEWSKRVRSGGIVAGHDYNVPRRLTGTGGVIPAVNAYVTAHKINPWFVTSNRTRTAMGRKKSRTFFWVKP